MLIAFRFDPYKNKEHKCNCFYYHVSPVLCASFKSQNPRFKFLRMVDAVDPKCERLDQARRETQSRTEEIIGLQGFATWEKQGPAAISCLNVEIKPQDPPRDLACPLHTQFRDLTTLAAHEIMAREGRQPLPGEGFRYQAPPLVWFDVKDHRFANGDIEYLAHEEVVGNRKKWIKMADKAFRDTWMQAINRYHTKLNWLLLTTSIGLL